MERSGYTPESHSHYAPKREVYVDRHGNLSRFEGFLSKEESDGLIVPIKDHLSFAHDLGELKYHVNKPQDADISLRLRSFHQKGNKANQLKDEILESLEDEGMKPYFEGNHALKKLQPHIDESAHNTVLTYAHHDLTEVKTVLEIIILQEALRGTYDPGSKWWLEMSEKMTFTRSR